MKKRSSIVAAFAVATVAGIGCWFCWHCPSFRCVIMKFSQPDMEFGEFGLTAKRGRILASDGSPLAYTERVWRFSLDPAVAKYHKTETACCSEVVNGLGISEICMANSLARKDSRYIFLKDADDNDPSVAYFEQNRKWLTKRVGVIREPVQKRVYPLGSAAVHVVGFMLGGAHTETPKGAGGLEFACNKALAGINGVYDKNLPAKERRMRAFPKLGADIRTTLEPEIQKAAAEALSSACATNGAESAFAIVMKVPSGEIAAMASWPSFDPSMRRYLNKWDGSMAVNRPAQVVFEPGALAKPIVEAIAKDAGELPKEKLHAGLLRFGFGAKTGTAGISGEETGFFVGPPDRWDETTEAGVGEGFGFAATGLQIAQSYATLANHGTLVRPVLVAAAATNGAVQAVSPSSADAIVRTLKSPVPSAVRMCEHDRETGHAVYSPTNYIASCAGFVPADKPRYVVVVSFSRPRPAYAGEEVAKPVFQAISNSL